MAAAPTTATSTLFQKLKGPLVPILAAFDKEERLDVDSVCKWVSHLIDSGIKMFWTTFGTSHYMCLDDAEIEALNRAVAGVTRGKAVFIASTAFSWSTQRCIDFTKRAAEWGADAVKLQIDWRWFPPTDDSVFTRYSAIAKETALPLLAYTWGTPAIKTPLLKRILQLPQFVGMKNDTGDFYEQVDYLRVIKEAGAADRFLPITGGTMESFLHGWQFGAQAFAVGTGIYAPQIAVGFYEHLTAKHFAEAAADIEKYELPMTAAFAPMGHWACFHAALKLQGLFSSATLPFPLRSLTAEEEAKVAVILREKKLIG